MLLEIPQRIRSDSEDRCSWRSPRGSSVTPRIDAPGDLPEDPPLLRGSMLLEIPQRIRSDSEDRCSWRSPRGSAVTPRIDAPGDPPEDPQ
ncbi:hypothetical protein QR680_014230 [Steinernema hermaphroditum]|uniref:Uncharacterized protein n=1 Tax=Steinernema hermaphroditum TaxID=289476 RepID=A0AA39I9Q7_9BILA|nr:hypothetical protein QR680_014230 [Steinernema hermaphroditum]